MAYLQMMREMMPVGAEITDIELHDFKPELVQRLVQWIERDAFFTKHLIGGENSLEMIRLLQYLGMPQEFISTAINRAGVDLHLTFPEFSVDESSWNVLVSWFDKELLHAKDLFLKCYHVVDQLPQGFPSMPNWENTLIDWHQLIGTTNRQILPGWSFDIARRSSLQQYCRLCMLREDLTPCDLVQWFPGVEKKSTDTSATTFSLVGRVFRDIALVDLDNDKICPEERMAHGFEDIITKHYFDRFYVVKQGIWVLLNFQKRMFFVIDFEQLHQIAFENDCPLVLLFFFVVFNPRNLVENFDLPSLPDMPVDILDCDNVLEDYFEGMSLPLLVGIDIKNTWKELVGVFMQNATIGALIEFGHEKHVRDLFCTNPMIGVLAVHTAHGPNVLLELLKSADVHLSHLVKKFYLRLPYFRLFIRTSLEFSHLKNIPDPELIFILLDLRRDMHVSNRMMEFAFREDVFPGILQRFTRVRPALTAEITYAISDQPTGIRPKNVVLLRKYNQGLCSRFCVPGFLRKMQNDPIADILEMLKTFKLTITRITYILDAFSHNSDIYFAIWKLSSSDCRVVLKQNDHLREVLKNCQSIQSLKRLHVHCIQIERTSLSQSVDVLHEQLVTAQRYRYYLDAIKFLKPLLLKNRSEFEHILPIIQHSASLYCNRKKRKV
jgi:hypothetical protein